MTPHDEIARDTLDRPRKRGWVLLGMVFLVAVMAWCSSQAAERPGSATAATACKMLRSGQVIREWVIPAGAECHAQCAAALEPIRRADAETKVSGSTRYTCREDRSTTVSYVRAPVEPPPTCTLPPNRQQACPEPAYRPGSWTQPAVRVTGTPPDCSVEWAAFNGLTSGCAPAEQSSETPRPPGVLHFDNFEYDIGRNVTDAGARFRAHGWPLVKSENNAAHCCGDGWVFTQQDATRGGRVLVLESRPTDSPPPGDFPYQQTDYYIQLGAENGPDSPVTPTAGNPNPQQPALPANSWIQFWTYATRESQFSSRDKTIYACRGAYPCHPTWLFMWGSQGFEETSAPAGARFLALEAPAADRNTAETGNEPRLYQNVSKRPLLRETWYQVRLHIDIEGREGNTATGRGTYQAWIRQAGEPWELVADWRDGVTRNFRWTVPAGERRGYRVVRIPTTVNRVNNTVKLDDFAITTSEAALPSN